MHALHPQMYEYCLREMFLVVPLFCSSVLYTHDKHAYGVKLFDEDHVLESKVDVDFRDCLFDLSKGFIMFHLDMETSFQAKPPSQGSPNRLVEYKHIRDFSNLCQSSGCWGAIAEFRPHLGYDPSPQTLAPRGQLVDIRKR